MCSRKVRVPNKDLLKLFIRAHALRSSFLDNCPWIVDESFVRKHSLPPVVCQSPHKVCRSHNYFISYVTIVNIFISPQVHYCATTLKNLYVQNHPNHGGKKVFQTANFWQFLPRFSAVFGEPCGNNWNMKLITRWEYPNVAWPITLLT